MRLDLIPPRQLDDQQRGLYEVMRKDIGHSFRGFVSARDDGALMGPWNPWLHQPKLGAPIWRLNMVLAAEAVLPARVREVAIMVVGARFGAAYETYAHAAVGKAVGLDDKVVAEICAGQRPIGLSKNEEVAYDVANALVGGSPLPDDLYRRAVMAFGEPGAAELFYLVGFYCLVSVTLNAFDVPLPNA